MNRSSEPETVTWYFDLVSPFAYLALPEVEALSRQRAVVFRPIVFGAVLAHWGQLGPAEIAPKRLHTYQLCQFLADRRGIAMRFPPRHPFRSLEALRTLAALRSPAPAVRAAFEFIWLEGRDVGDPAEAGAFSERLGLHASGHAAIEQDAKSVLRDWTNDAIALGVFGVPTLAVGSRLFWGLDAMPMALAYMADPDLFDRGEMARLATLDVGVERKSPRLST